MAEFESLLNLVCILLSGDVIGFRFTHHSFFSRHTRALWNWLPIFSLRVSRFAFKCQLFSRHANEAGRCCDGKDFVHVSHLCVALNCFNL